VQLKAKVAEGRHRATAARTVADLLERWLEWRQGVKEISPTTLEDYRLQINRRIVPALGNLPVRRLDAETLDRFYAEAAQARPRRRQASERGVVYVPGRPLIEKTTKTRSKRRLALDARTVELLRAYLVQMQRTADELGSTLRADAFVFSRERMGHTRCTRPA
jgi:hypothetical protein